MTTNEVATLVTDAGPYVTAAIGAYGHAVLSKSRDKIADATVGAGVGILQRIFGRKKAGDPLPEPLADVVAHPHDDELATVLNVAIRKELDRDSAVLEAVRSIIDAAPKTAVAQQVHAGRDAYVSGRDMTIHQRPD